MVWWLERLPSGDFDRPPTSWNSGLTAGQRFFNTARAAVRSGAVKEKSVLRFVTDSHGFAYYYYGEVKTFT
jgi:hypothetical protein